MTESKSPSGQPDLIPSSSTLLLLVRHAQTIDNLEQRFAGWTDGDLTPYGERQIHRLGEHFNRAHSDVEAIYSSPLTRARKTAEAISKLTAHELRFDDDLREMYFGELDGRPFEELRSAYADVMAADEDAELNDFMWPGGESRSGFTTRVVECINRIALTHLGGSAAIVTHGGVIATFLTNMHGESTALWRKWVVPNASLTEINWDPSKRRGVVLRRGDDAHLSELKAEEAARNIATH